MRNFLSVLIGLYLLVNCYSAQACLLDVGYHHAIPIPGISKNNDGIALSRPIVEVQRLERGDGGSGTKPCGHRAYLEIRVKPSATEKIVGYYFTDPGDARPQFHIPTTIMVLPRKSDDGRAVFWFSWLEPAPIEGVLPPIRFRLYLSKVGANGGVSEPVEILVEHPGVRPANNVLH